MREVEGQTGDNMTRQDYLTETLKELLREYSLYEFMQALKSILETDKGLKQLEEYICKNDLKDKILLIASERHVMTVKEVYNLVNDTKGVKIKC